MSLKADSSNGTKGNPQLTKIGPDAHLSKQVPGVEGTAEPSVAPEYSFVQSASPREVGRGDVHIDARYSRSYYFVPFLDEELGDDKTARPTYDENVRRIQKHVKDAREEEKPVTDLIIMAHGWHRNLFSSISAYDRLTRIFLDLRARGKLEDLPDSDGFRPLLVGVHYHSDPGKNAWIDYSGRRDRESFLRNVERGIEPRAVTLGPAMMQTDFEDVFDLFSRLASPGVKATEQGMTRRSYDIETVLSKYCLVSDPNAEMSDVLTVAWACYHEADIVPQAVEQTTDPSRTVTFLEWASALLALVVALFGGWMGVVGLTNGVIKGFFSDLYSPKEYGAWMQNLLPFLKPAMYWLWPLVVSAGIWIALWLCLWVVVFFTRELRRSHGVGVGVGYLTRARRRQLQDTGTRLFGSLFYLPLQVVHMAPIIVWCIITPFFATWYGVLIAGIGGGVTTYLLSAPGPGKVWYVTIIWTVVWLWLALSVLYFSRSGYLSERPDFGTTDTVPPPPKLSVTSWPGWLRGFFAEFALWPIRTAKRISRPEQTWVDVWHSIEGLLAFWTMSVKAVQIGGHVGKFIEDVAQGGIDRGDPGREGVPGSPAAVNEQEPTLRIHLVGHSHGGLVVCNTANWLCRRLRDVTSMVNEVPSDKRELGAIELQTVVTINGAYRADWFEGQNHVMAGLNGCVASLFSRYDTANSLWYPLANIGRKASGSVGLWISSPHPPPEIAEPLPSITVSDARYDPVSGQPDMCGRIDAVGQCPEKARILNIDASRFVFKGPFLPQGAHSEIYSKDVIASLWRVLQFSVWLRSQQ